MKNKQITMRFEDNPLDNYIQLPENLKDLSYSNVLLGGIKGALQAVNSGYRGGNKRKL